MTHRMFMPEKHHGILNLFFALIALILSQTGYGASTAPVKQLNISTGSEQISMTFQNVKLCDAVAEIGRIRKIEIVGLEKRNKETIIFQITDATVENAFKALLKHLGETSYAFQYKGNSLYRIAVVETSRQAYPSLLEKSPVEMPLPDPTSSTDISIESAPADEVATPSIEPEAPEDTIKAVQVINVVAESQGAKAGLMRGDIILEYNGTAIDLPETLINAVKQNISQETITMTVERDDELIDIDLQGGFIGVSIVPVTLPR